EPNRKALGQLDNIMSVGLGAGLSLSLTSREEALIRPLGNDNVPVYANESDFLPLLDPSGQMLWESQSHMEQATQPTPTLTTDGRSSRSGLVSRALVSLKPLATAWRRAARA